MENKIISLENEIKKLKEMNLALEAELLDKGKISSTTISRLFEAFRLKDFEKIKSYGLFIGEQFQKNPALRLSAKVINSAVTGVTDPDKIIPPCALEEPVAYKHYLNNKNIASVIVGSEPFDIQFVLKFIIRYCRCINFF